MFKFFKIVILFLAIFTGSKIRSNETEIIYVLTIPKSGTHLIKKYFQLLSIIEKDSSFTLRGSHLSTTDLNLPKNFFRENPNVKKIIMIRDLRDVFCSTLDHIENKKHYLHSKIKFSKKWRKLSTEKKIHQLLDFDSKTYFSWKDHGKSLPMKLNELISRAIEYSMLPHTCVVNFEKLVGPEGGAVSEEAQRAEIKKINDYIGIQLDENEYEFIIENLFGNKLVESYSFRKGRVGVWKEAFDPELKRTFKIFHGQHLIDLGYEKDHFW